MGIVSESRSSLSIIAPGFLAATLFLVFEVVCALQYHACNVRADFPQRFSMIIHQIQGPEDAVMRAPVTAATPTPTPDAVPASDLPPAPSPQTATTTPARGVEQSGDVMARARRLIGALRSSVNNMTDPDSKFCKCPDLLEHALS